MKKIRRNSGFTTVELVIALAIFAVVGTLMTGLVVMASNYTSEQNIISNRMREIDESKEMIIQWFSTYDSIDYDTVIIENNKVIFSGNALEFTEGNLISSESSINVQYIAQINFEQVVLNKLIKCIFTLDNQQEFVFLIHRRSI